MYHGPVMQPFSPKPAHQVIASLPIPKPCEEIGGAIFLFSFICLFIGLALANLLRGEAILPSAIWLLLVGTGLVSGSHVEGPRGLALDFLGSFAPRHYLWHLQTPEGSAVIGIGFTCVGYRLVRWAIPIGCIERISWTPGQGTAMSGRDVNDWSVGLWWRPGREEASHRPSGRFPCLEIVILGPASPRAQAEALGRTVADFLQGIGVPLKESLDREYPVFVRTLDNALGISATSHVSEKKIP